MNNLVMVLDAKACLLLCSRCAFLFARVARAALFRSSSAFRAFFWASSFLALFTKNSPAIIVAALFWFASNRSFFLLSRIAFEWLIAKTPAIIRAAALSIASFCWALFSVTAFLHLFIANAPAITDAALCTLSNFRCWIFLSRIFLNRFLANRQISNFAAWLSCSISCSFLASLCA